MRILLILCAGVFVAACSRKPETAAQKLARATTEVEQFWALGPAAKENLDEGKIEEARRCAERLLGLAPKHTGDWNYGNALHDGNLVMGRIALREGKVTDAKQRLLEAGKSPGSPQLNSFGPSMTLARDLIAKGERDVVLEYFELCRRFWKSGSDRLDRWSNALKTGGEPDFGVNVKW